MPRLLQGEKAIGIGECGGMKGVDGIPILDLSFSDIPLWTSCLGGDMVLH